MDAVAIVVRVVSPEVAGTVPGHGVTLTRRHAVHVVAVVHAEVVMITVVVTGVAVNLLAGRVGYGGAAEAAAAHIGATHGGR